MTFKIMLQHLAPQHALSRLAGWIAECKWPWLKNWLIRDFIRRYQADLRIAQLEQVEDYLNFNHFFTRKLKPALRPIAEGTDQIISPVDGSVSQLGSIQEDVLFQAKGFYFNLKALLGGDELLANTFQNGQFATLYLSPKDYHRVHMPLDGTLRETIYLPGKLFSVNQQTAAAVPELFSRNERLVCLFETAIGSMAVIMVGAMLVSSIHTAWPLTINRNILSKTQYPNTTSFARGDELGFFKLGSTVILLFQKNAMQWSTHLAENMGVRMGESIGKKSSNESGF